MCNNRDIAKLEAEVDVVRKAKRAALDYTYAEKRRYEAAIIDALIVKAEGSAKISFVGQKRPHTTVEVTAYRNGNPSDAIRGLGVARCQARDTWDREQGREIATKNAIRHAARQLAGLE